MQSKWNFEKLKKGKFINLSVLKLLLTSYKIGELKYIVSFQIENAASLEENDGLNALFCECCEAVWLWSFAASLENL